MQPAGTERAQDRRLLRELSWIRRASSRSASRRSRASSPRIATARRRPTTCRPRSRTSRGSASDARSASASARTRRHSTVNIVQVGQSGLGLARPRLLPAQGRRRSPRPARRTSTYITRLFTLAEAARCRGRGAAHPRARDGDRQQAVGSRHRAATATRTYNKMTVAELAGADAVISTGAPTLEGGGARRGDATSSFASPTTSKAIERRRRERRRSPRGRNTSRSSCSTSTPTSCRRRSCRREFDFRGKTLSGQQEMQPRWKRGVARSRRQRSARPPASSTSSSTSSPRPRRAWTQLDEEPPRGVQASASTASSG